MIGERISHYTILSRLGAGGMGVVYEAEDTRLGRRVAIKFLPDDAHADAEAVRRFLREARVVSALNHPHICTLHDIGTHQGRHYMVMELLEGQTLKDRIAAGPLPLDQVLEFGEQVADALDAAHAQGVVHRDIKPANLFVTRRGAIKVLDFGVAKLSRPDRGGADLGATRATDQLTTMGTTVGTVSYMSPEQARGQEIDARSDVFSAGVVLYEMATGRLPFQGATVATIFEALLTKPPAAPSGVRAGLPPEFDHIVLKALEKDRETRYQGAAELRADLKRLRRSTDSGAVAAASRPRVAAVKGVPAAAPAPSRWRTPVYVGAPLLTAALVGGFLLYRSITAPALTEKDTVVLSSVVNRTGDTMFDDTLGEALALQLRQSPFLNVVPEQQVAATLRLMGRDPMTPITEDVGREVCQRAGATALLGGTIAMLGSSYVITLNAQDCVVGRVIAEEQAQAPTKESVLAVMGDAVSRFRERLGESLDMIQRYDVKIEQATTPSLEALKAYSQAIRTRRMTGDFDSVPLFRRAIELDPEFALAYARLGTVYGNLGQLEEARKMTARAYELRRKVSEVERLYIEARYFSVVEPDLQKALDAYRVWLATYPNDYAALQNSALLDKQQGNRAEAIRKLELATQVAPDEPVAWSNLGQTYVEAGEYDKARRVMETAITLRDTTGARVALFQAAILLGDRALAEQQVAAVQGRRDDADMVATRMFAAAYRGRMNEAAELAIEYQAKMTALSRRPQAGQAVLTLALSEAMAGLGERARARMAAAEEDGAQDDSSIDERLAVAAMLGDGRAAEALLAPALAANARGNRSNAQAVERANALRALALMAQGKPQEALRLIEPVTLDTARTELVGLWALCKFQAADFPSAVKGFTFLTSREARVALTSEAAHSTAMLARAHARLGQIGPARQAYQKLFELWKDADPDVPLLIQAREEFARLTGS